MTSAENIEKLTVAPLANSQSISSLYSDKDACKKPICSVKISINVLYRTPNNFAAYRLKGFGTFVAVITFGVTIAYGLFRT